MAAMSLGLLRLVRQRIAIKLTLTLVGFVAVSTIVAGAYLSRALERFAVESLADRLATAGRLLHDEARALVGREAGAPGVRAFVLRAAGGTGARLTLVAADGTVVGDSDLSIEGVRAAENHGERPEILAAMQGRLGRDVRTSATVGAALLYVAMPLHEGGRVAGVLRLALPVAAVTSSYADLMRVMVAGGLVALAVAFGIGVFVAGRVTRPVVQMQAIARQMSEGRFDVRAPVRSMDEIGALGRALNVMAGRLREKIGDLEQEQAKATAILDGMVEGVIAVDGHDGLLLMNERARAILGVPPAPGERRPFQEVVRNADLHAIFRETRATAPGEAVRREMRLARPVDRTLQVNAVPFRLGRDETGVVMVLHDVSELRRLEAVRTEFIANVSHELRTPLTAIQGYLETLLEGALDERDTARRFLEVAFRHTERLGRLLGDLTDLSNIELGKVSLHLAPVAVLEAVESTFAIMEPRAKAGPITLSADVEPRTLAVHADRDRLAQILINLVDNAVKYTPGGGRVAVAARSLADGFAEIAVTDTGIGISPADLPRITERFYRVDRARSRELGGTGLGLAIVKHLVLAHGGVLAVESQLGRGTTVRFTIPMTPRPGASQLPLPIPAWSRSGEESARS